MNILKQENGGFPGQSRAEIGGLQAGRKQRKPGPNMTQQDSGNMMLLLNAVEDVKSMERPSSEARRQGRLQVTQPLCVQQMRSDSRTPKMESIVCRGHGCAEKQSFIAGYMPRPSGLDRRYACPFLLYTQSHLVQL